MTKPPDNLITPHKTNITGRYRECEEPNCTTYIKCPYCFCLKHWVALTAERPDIEYKG